MQLLVNILPSIDEFVTMMVTNLSISHVWQWSQIQERAKRSMQLLVNILPSIDEFVTMMVTNLSIRNVWQWSQIQERAKHTMNKNGDKFKNE